MTAPDTFRAAWERWRAQRARAVTAPDGPLALTLTHHIADAPQVPGTPGRWTSDGDEVVLTAAGADRIAIDGKVVDGRVWLRPDQPPTRITFPGGLLQPIERDGMHAVRVFRPDTDALRGFAGIDTFDPDPAWVVTGVFHAAAPRTAVGFPFSGDGVTRTVDVPGMVRFQADGRTFDLTAFPKDGGMLHLPFADATTGRESCAPARFLFAARPADGGDVTLDFNRAVLPPCAFSEAFNCPLPPPGNRLPVPVAAGEQRRR